MSSYILDAHKHKPTTTHTHTPRTHRKTYRHTYKKHTTPPPPPKKKSLINKHGSNLSSLGAKATLGQVGIRGSRTLGVRTSDLHAEDTHRPPKENLCCEKRQHRWDSTPNKLGLRWWWEFHLGLQCRLGACACKEAMGAIILGPGDVGWVHAILPRLLPSL